MGISKVEEIMECFSGHGKGNTPVAIIQNGTLPSQKHVIGTVSTITALLKIEDIHSPGIIIVGEVVKNALELEKIITEKVHKNYE